MSRYEAYQKARKEYLKKRERDANSYQFDALRANAKATAWKRKQSQKYI